VGAVRVPGGGKGPPEPVLAAAAPGALIDALYAAAEGAGWRVEGIVPAEAAWAVAAAAEHEALRKRAGDVAVPLEDRTEVLRVRAGRVLAVRRYPVGVAPRGEGDAAPLRIAGDATPEASPDLLAALFAARTHGPELAPERVHVERARRVRRTTGAVWAMAAALIVVAAGLEL